MNMRRSALLLATLLGLGGCEDTSNLFSAPPAAPRVAMTTALRLQVGDKIKLTVIGDDKISGEYEIDPSGDISVPAAGSLHVAGMTKGELEGQLARKLRERQYLLNPMVTIDISAFRPFYVLGEVAKPGEYPYHTGLNVLSAVAVAGGDTYRANSSRALIQRAGEQGFREYPLSPEVPIYPGDLIKIPERWF